MNVILEDPESVTFFTDMREVLARAGVDPEDFEWFVSDIETNVHAGGRPIESGWMSGVELRKVLEAPGLQFIWAVFSAFPAGVRCHVENLPYADGNASFWSEAGVMPQLPGASFEIVAWDSSATLLIGVPDDIGHAFMRNVQAARTLVADP